MRWFFAALFALAGIVAVGFTFLLRGIGRGEAAPAAVAAMVAPAPPGVRIIKARGQLGPGRGTLVIDLTPPEGAKLTEGAPLVVEASGEHLAFPERIRRPLDPAALPLRIPVDVTDGALGPASVELGFYWCEDGNTAACRPERVKLEVELDLSGDAAGGEAFFEYRAEK